MDGVGAKWHFSRPVMLAVQVNLISDCGTNISPSRREAGHCLAGSISMCLAFICRGPMSSRQQLVRLLGARYALPSSELYARCTTRGRFQVHEVSRRLIGLHWISRAWERFNSFLVWRRMRTRLIIHTACAAALDLARTSNKPVPIT